MPDKKLPITPALEPTDAIVIAPGGPRPSSTTTLVEHGQAVFGQAQGGVAVAPAQNMRQDGTPATATDLVLTPGGYRQSSLVHRVESGALIDSAANTLRTLSREGTELLNLGTLQIKQTGRPLMPENVTRLPPAAAVPALGSGWICYAGWTESASPVSLFTTTWVVPPDPATQSGQTIFLFNGIQNSTMIYQPVLQWGPSAAGGGNYWAVASWYADGQGGHSFYTSPVRVSVGQVLTGIMTETGSSAQGFSYNCVFSGIANTSLVITNVQELTWCVQTLEAYGVQKCSDYPNTNVTAMTGIQIQAGGANVTPSWSASSSVTDCGQHAVVVSNASPGGEVDLFYNNTQPFSNKVTLADTTPQSPALASLNGDLFIAWKGDGNDNLNVMGSANNGLSFGGKQTFGDTSPVGPSICGHSNGMLYLAWKGDGNDNLNIAQVHVSGSNVTGLSNKVVLGDTSPLSPAIASLNGNLFLAWKGDGNNNLNVMVSTDNGAHFGGKFTSPETSVQAPGLAVYNGELYITWKGAGNDNLNLALVNHSANAVTGFVSKVTLPDTSPLSPTLAANNGKLYVAWKGDGNDNLNAESTSDGHTFIGKYTSPETSPKAPALCANNGLLFIAWKGDGNDQLNVARINN